MQRSSALIVGTVFVVWLAFVWATLGSGAAFAAFWTGIIGWGIGRTWDQPVTTPPSPGTRASGD